MEWAEQRNHAENQAGEHLGGIAKSVQRGELLSFLFGLQRKSKLDLDINFSVVVDGILSKLGTLTELLWDC